MSVVEEDSPEIICFQEFQNTPVSSAVIIYIYPQIILLIITYIGIFTKKKKKKLIIKEL